MRIDKIKVNNTDYTIGGDPFDGPVIGKHVDIYKGVSISTETYDLSSYLPDNSHDYLVLLTADGLSGTSGQSVCVVTPSSSYDLRLFRSTASNGVATHQGQPTWVVVRKENQTIKIYTKGCDKLYIYLNAYQRLGTNE